MVKYTQYSEDGEKWSFGGAAPFKYRRTFTVEKKDGKTVRKFGPVEEIEPTKRDPNVFGCEPKK